MKILGDVEFDSGSLTTRLNIVTVSTFPTSPTPEEGEVYGLAESNTESKPSGLYRYDGTEWKPLQGSSGSSNTIQVKSIDNAVAATSVDTIEFSDLTVNSNIATVQSYKPKLALFSSSNTISINTNNEVDYVITTNEYIDTEYFSHTLNTTDVTILKAGYYRVTYSMHFRSIPGVKTLGSLQFRLFKGATPLEVTTSEEYFNSKKQTYGNVNNTTVIYLAVNDVLSGKFKRSVRKVFEVNPDNNQLSLEYLHD